MKKSNNHSMQWFADNLNRNVILDDEWEKSLVSRALIFAMIAHNGQVRKADGQPYIVHPISVAILVAKVIPKNDHVIAAALLHDTLEDTDTTFEELEKEFGYTVPRIVKNLTEDKTIHDWKKRKLATIEHIKEMDEWSLIVKTADKLHNLRSLYSVLLEEGMDVMRRFNAPFEDQLALSKLIYKELAKNFKKSELWRNNELLVELKGAIEDLVDVPKRRKLFKP
ncbi:HD domain-containing protein [Patescibacteria group bacterium]|nr:HD domain-containing protein [Patescibacteria group bacterium]